VKIRVWIATNRVGSRVEDTVEVDAAAWAAMSEDEREALCMDVAFEMVDWGFEKAPG